MNGLTYILDLNTPNVDDEAFTHQPYRVYGSIIYCSDILHADETSVCVVESFKLPLIVLNIKHLHNEWLLTLSGCQ